MLPPQTRPPPLFGPRLCQPNDVLSQNPFFAFTAMNSGPGWKHIITYSRSPFPHTHCKKGCKNSDMENTVSRILRVVYSGFFLLQTGKIINSSQLVWKKTVSFLGENPQQWAGKKKNKTHLYFSVSGSSCLEGYQKTVAQNQTTWESESSEPYDVQFSAPLFRSDSFVVFFTVQNLYPLFHNAMAFFTVQDLYLLFQK